jgi:uncharacterized protein
VGLPASAGQLSSRPLGSAPSRLRKLPTLLPCQFRRVRRMDRNHLELHLLHGLLAVVRLQPGSPVPEWAKSDILLSVTWTDSETSIVCDELGLPAGIEAERGLRCLRIRGPLPFTLVGILRSILGPLGDAGISVFAVSTFNTDYILLPGSGLEDAITALSEAGHVVHR